jgi:5-methylcytosine-specific restriction endonuclease McrA
MGYQPIKQRTKPRTKALSITKEVKERVLGRDGGLCVYCGKPGNPEAHYVPRSQGGLGIEQNILTLCRDCHREFDQSIDRPEMAAYFERYLRSKYPGWDDIQLTYQKD